MPIFTILSRLLLVITCLVGGALSVAGVSLYQSRHQILAQAVTAVEQGASEALGVPVSIGKVEGPFWNGLQLRDLKVYASHAPGAPVIAYAPRARAAYSILEILRLGRQPIMVDVYSPQLTLTRDAKGRLNYQPTFKPGPTEPPQIPNLPRLRVRVHSGAVTWTDQGMPRVARFQAQLARVAGTVDLVDKQLRFRGSAREGASRLEVTGAYALERMAGSVQATAHDVPTARWINYLASNPQFSITGGAARVETKVVWDRPAAEAVKVTGAVDIQNMSLTAKDVLKPVEAIFARATFDNQVAVVPEVRGTMCGQAFSGSGRVLDLNQPVQRLAFTGGAQNVDVASLVPLVPDLAMWKPAGKGAASAVVSGTTMHPVVDGSAVIPEGHVLDQVVTNVTGQFHYEGMDVNLPVFQGTLNGGRVWGTTAFTLDRDPKIVVDAQYEGVDLPKTLAPYVKEALPLSGRLAGKVAVRGTSMRPEVSGSVAVAEARYRQQEFRTATADFTYVKNRWELPRGELGLGNGAVRFSAQGNENGVFAGRFEAGQLALSTLKALGIEAEVAGTATATGSFAGDVTRPEEIRGFGSAHVEAGVLYGQPVARAAAKWAIADHELRLTDVTALGAGGNLKGQARIALFGRTPMPVMQADFAAEGLELLQIEPLQEALANDVGSMRGTVSATGSVQSDGRTWRAQADTVGTSLDAERFGRVTRAAGPVYFGHTRITLGELSLQLANKSPAMLRGSIAFDRSVPALDLEFSMQNVPARDALSAVHWQRLLQGTWIGRKLGVKESEGPLETVASFADREPVVDARGQVNLNALLSHWDRNHLEPLKTNQAYLAAKDPFWQSIDGNLTLEVAYQGLVTEPEVRVRSSLKQAVAYGHPLRNAHFTAVYRNQRLYVPVFDVIEEGGTGAALQARGMLGPDGVLGVYGQNLDLSWANPWLQAQELELAGQGGFTLLAKGDPSDPKLEISAEVYDGAIGPAGAKVDDENRFTYQRGEVKATYYKGRVTLDNAKVVKDDKEAHILGSFPVVPGLSSDELDVALALEGDSLGIVSAFTRGEIQWKGGPGIATLKLGGTLEDPELSGVIDLQGVTIHDRNLKHDISNIRAYATVTTDAVTVQRATGTYGGGTLSASGQIKLKRFQLDRLRLQALARQVNFELTNGLYKGMVEASLEVNGTLQHPVIGGTVAISRGIVDLNALTPAEGVSSAAAPEVPIDLKDLTLRVHQGVTVLGPRQPVVVLADARIFDLGIDGSLVVNGPVDKPQVRGTIRTPNGNINPLNTPFDVTSGTIEFLGPGIASTADSEFEELLPTVAQAKTSTLPNARLNIVAKGQVYDYSYHNGGKLDPKNLDIKMTLTGSLDNMERKFEAVNDASVTQDRIERLLGKESMVTGILAAENVDERNKIVSTEVSGFLSTASRRFFTPVTSRLQDFLQLESLGFDLAALPGSNPDTAFFQQLGLNPSVYTQTRPILGSVSLSGRYTFRQNSENVYQAGINYGINEFLSLNLGVDNLNLKGQAEPAIKNLNFNPSITLSTQRRF